MNTKSGTGPKR